MSQFFNEITDNVVSNSFNGIGTAFLEDTPPLNSFLGNRYSRNNISNVPIDIPPLRESYSSALFTGAGLNVQTYQDYEKVIQGSIYEDNIINSTPIGFMQDKNYGEKIVFRNNIFSNLVNKGVEWLIPVQNIFDEGNIVNVLPQFNLTAVNESDVKIICRYTVINKGGINYYPDSQRECFSWNKDGSGSITIAPFDVDEDEIGQITIDPIEGVSISENSLSWQGLAPGVYPIKVYASDGKEIGLKVITLYVGDYFDFNLIDYEFIQEGEGASLVFTLIDTSFSTANTLKVSSVDGSSFKVEPRLPWAIHDGLTIEQARQQDGLEDVLLIESSSSFAKVIPEGMSATLSDNAVVSFFEEDVGYGYEVKLKLKQNESNYYEFYDYYKTSWGGELRGNFSTSIIRKIVNNQVVQTVYAPIATLAANQQVSFEKYGSVLRVKFGGEVLEMYDSDPLEISTYELDLVNAPKVDNLFFAKDVVVPEEYI
jgi:hypothetical protein